MGSIEKMENYIEKKSSRVMKADDNVCIARIRQLMDEDSFVEINSHVKARGISFGFERKKVEGDGVVTGYGSINGNLVFVAVQDPDVYAGSMGQMHAAKISEIIDMAVRSNAPFIGLYDSGGARIEEGILALEGMAEVLSGINVASRQIPVIAGILGPCPGGSAIAAGLSHFRFMTESPSGIYMNGPMVTAASNGKTMEPSEIGGAKIHNEKTGLASFVYSTEEECLESIRNLIEYIPGYHEEVDDFDDSNRVEARLDEIAQNIDSGYDVREIIKSISDTDTFLEVSSGYADGVITALAKFEGYPVAVIANNSKRMDAKMALKLRTFVKTCDVLELPLISLVDCQGFSIGVEHEYSDIVKNAGELFAQIDNYESPKISIIIGEAIGTAYITLASKQNGFDFVYAWPTAEISVVTSDTAANILYKDDIAASSDVITSRADFVSRYSNEVADATVAAAYGHVDEIIMPSATRPRIISALQII